MKPKPRIYRLAGVWYVSTPARYTAAYSRNYVVPALCFVDRLNSGGKP